MASFLNGADCGPTNALKSVSGRLERDNALQQDRLISEPNVAGPSSQPFNSFQQAPYRHPRPSSTRPPQTPFDLSSLRDQLNTHPQAPQRNHPAEWAASFQPQRSAGSMTHTYMRPAPDERHVVQSNPWGEDFLRQSTSTPSYISASTVSGEHQPQAEQLGHYVPIAQNLPWADPAQGMLFRPSGPSMDGFLSDRQMNVRPQFLQLNRPLVDSRNDNYTAADAGFHHPNTPMWTGPPLPRQTEVLRNYTRSEDPAAAATTSKVHENIPVRPLSADQELLAQTAQNLVDGLAAESRILKDNPKLAQSDFFKLVQGLGGRKVVVEEGRQKVDGEEVGEGASFVTRGGRSDWASAFMSQDPTTTSSKSTLQTSSQFVPAEWDQQFLDQEAILQSQSMSSRPRSKSVHFDDEQVQPLGNGIPSSLEEALMNSTAIPGASSAWQEDLDDDLDFDEEALQHFNGPMRTAHSHRLGVGALENWGELQSDWETFERGNLAHQEDRGRYLFQSANPYATSVQDVERLGRESPTLKGVLELEADVQANPRDHKAWYALGLKQQENEREDQALLALLKVVELDPDYRPAYLALGVSYTNEGNKGKAIEMLERWVDLSGAASVAEHQQGMKLSTRREKLVDALVELARQSPEEVDADVQMALGVIFNASEEWDKAEDCFFAALSARPNDWLLYNRLGATMANSGRSAEAIEFYHQALSLHPNFVRALFNLGIARSNNGQYALAAQKILNALRLQHADATEGYSSYAEKKFSVKGVTSETLWITLRNACLHMGRQDLVALAANKDLAAFPLSLEHEADNGQEVSGVSA